MTDRPFSLTRSTLVTGPSQAGKTRLTARALEAWLDAHGSAGVVVLEFAPEVRRADTVLGGRLDRFTTIPKSAWVGVLDAHAPRTEGSTEAEVLDLARDNASRARRILDAAPEPTAVFVNDATIPLQAGTVSPSELTEYCEQAECVVVNAFESDELGKGDHVSRTERAALRALRAWADRVIGLTRSSQ